MDGRRLAIAGPVSGSYAIVAAAERALVHEFIIDLPDGYATDIGEAGARLSGGQRQRVAVARALVHEPRAVLADEPTGNLDSERSHEIMELLVRLNDEQGITVILVTHESEMARYAKRCVNFLDGRIQSDDIVGVESGCYGTC